MTIDGLQDELIETFELFDDWEQKYEYIIDLGRKLQPLEEKHKKDENIIQGCQSIVWLHSFLENGKIKYQAGSEAIIVKGLIQMLITVMDNHSPEEIISSDLYFIEKIGLGNHLAQTRANGLAAMIKKMKAYAQVLST